MIKQIWRPVTNVVPGYRRAWIACLNNSPYKISRSSYTNTLQPSPSTKNFLPCQWLVFGISQQLSPFLSLIYQKYYTIINIKSNQYTEFTTRIKVSKHLYTSYDFYNSIWSSLKCYNPSFSEFIIALKNVKSRGS